MLSTDARCSYRKNQLGDVICQLRFPEILSIASNPPAAFQDLIRDDYPRYIRNLEAAPPKVSGTPGSLKLENPPATVNHYFGTTDGIWRVNLTSKFISLTCSHYTGWEEFAARLDKPLAAFIQTYHAAYFERVGLRYVNIISRNNLGMVGTPFSELISPCYLGILAEEDVAEASITRCMIDTEAAIRGGARVKIHAGPGMRKQPNGSDNEVKFIFDQDLYMSGNLPLNLSAGALQTLHDQAGRIFRGAVTPKLHNAMEPVYL